MPIDDLLKHHISESRDRFIEIRGDLKEIKDELGELRTFKTEILEKAKVVSFMWSMVWGGVMMVVTLVLKKYV